MKHYPLPWEAGHMRRAAGAHPLAPFHLAGILSVYREAVLRCEPKPSAWARLRDVL